MNSTAALIAATYLDLAKDVMQLPVALLDLREQLDLPREVVDATILEMTKTGFVHLLPSSDRSRNDSEVMEAAIPVGGERKDFLVFEGEFFGE
ncbi:hypothetical protein BBK82_03460 [Lentzea guizhouensis]|uniref:Uncharacterized protein n=1 Tax=Lentzea guizhouensis TaxID=1586287 RepID=A0A1B2HC35_9PSEU|nr:hypothetical protein [Lentzea guizhouensis]ANZ35273.1 hypothetical protein BBK82_03460 [Lentzea guizhouensis]